MISPPGHRVSRRRQREAPPAWLDFSWKAATNCDRSNPPLGMHLMPCHHALAEALHAYINAAVSAEDRKGFPFRTSSGHNANALSDQPMDQSAALRMIRRRAAVAGIHAPIGNHTFRATEITAYLSNGGALEHAQEMAAHESPRT